MDTRERFQAVMNFRPFDRLPIVEWATWWDKTVSRWRNEGLPQNVKSSLELFNHFGLDVYQQFWVRPRKKGCPEPAHHGAPLIKSEADYDRFREHLFPSPALAHQFNMKDWEEAAREQSGGNRVIWFTVEGFFWFPRTLFGIEPHLYAFYDSPELMHRINSDMVDFILRIVDEICQICTPDFMTFAEDMSYNHGPMISRTLFDEFLLPHYQRVMPELKKRGIIPIVDSDGDVTTLCPWFASAGIEGVLPLERQARCDINRLRSENPGMRFIGHFNKMVMPHGEAAMRAEFERLLPVAAKGGFIPSVDHQTPPGVSYKDYQLYLALFREYADEAGKRSRGI
jgi:hypothetical protein